MTPAHAQAIATAAPSLLTDVLRRFGRVQLRATGTSMLPSISPGDVLLVVQCSPESIEPGDVVVFTDRTRVFAHRLVEKRRDLSGSSFVTRGDSTWHNDPPSRDDQLIGKVVAVRSAGQRPRETPSCSRIDRARGLVASEWIAAVQRARALVRQSATPDAAR
jgi:signal peptidase I